MTYQPGAHKERGLLVVQITLALGLNLNREKYAAFEPEERLLAFDAGAADTIRIDGEEGGHVVLRKHNGRWTLPALADFPADQGSVERLLERLAGLKKGWPVATTGAASKRFKVAGDAFERKLTLSQAEETAATVYVGTSPGFRKVQVRRPDEDAVYAVPFSTFEAGVEPEDWIDKSVLTHDAGDIQRIELPGFSLQREAEALVVAALGENEETVADEAKRLLDRIAGLRISTVLGREQQPDGGENAQAALRYTLALTSGKAQTYAFFKPKEGEYYVLTVSDRDEHFKVDNWVVDPIKEVTRDKLVRAKSGNGAPGVESDPAEAAPAGQPETVDEQGSP
jgi:hypothetical protein